MIRTRYASLVLATLVASPFGCSSDAANAAETGSAAQSPASSASAGTSAVARPGATGNSTPTATTDNTPGSSAGTTQGSTSAGAPTSTAGKTSPSGVIDPNGVWWTEVMTLGSEVLPILDKLDGTNIRFVMRVEVSGTAPNNTVKFDFCQLQTEWIDPMDPNNITTIGFRPNTVAAFSETRTADLGGLSAGSKVPLPSLTFRGGTDESGKQVDDDGDGNPAVTAWVQTLLGVQIEVFETITINAALDLTAPDENTLVGTVDFRADAKIVSSNNVIIAAGTEVTITPDNKMVPVTAKRLPAGGDCSSLPSTLKFTTVPPPPPVIIPPPEADPDPDTGMGMEMGMEPQPAP